MVAEQIRTKLTYEDYAAMPEGDRYELIDGVLIVVASPNREHQSIQFELSLVVGNLVKAEDLGWVFNPPFDVLFSRTEVVQPDLIFVSKEREDIITDANIRGAPDLVVEILSPSSTRRDWRDKFDMYERHGVREYWLIDPDRRMAWLFTTEDGAFIEAGRYSAEDALASSVLGGASIDLSEVFPSP